MTNTDIVRAMFDSYLSQDRGRAEELLADDFRFTSPQDDHIDRAAFFERCFPTTARLASYEIRYLATASDEDVFVMYDYALQTGEHHRNVEVLTVRDRHIVETQVFFGGPVRV
jgi:ketosteroid isomerase-like protein